MFENIENIEKHTKIIYIKVAPFPLVMPTTLVDFKLHTKLCHNQVPWLSAGTGKIQTYTIPAHSLNWS